ncbi:Uncharacterised protein [Klebsiella pneumoniae]|nr:Uncharacterised protein [Klebsiella pneumoniae]
MILPAEQQKWFRQNHFTLKVCRRARINHDAKIHFPLADTLQHPLLGPIVQHKIDIGITTIAVSNTLRNKVSGNRLTGGDLDGAAQLLANPPGVAQGNRQLIEQTFQPARQLLARLGEHHFTSSTVEQTDAGLMLQLLDAMADGRLT